MHRAGYSGNKKPRGGRSGVMQSFAAPVLAVLVIVMLILGVGYWGKGGQGAQPASKPATAPPSPPVKAPPAPAAQAPQKPEQQQKEDPNQAVLEARRHIDRAGGAKETMLVTVYYADGLTNGLHLQPVEVRIPGTKAVVKAAADQVIEQPSDVKLFSSVPAGTKVRSVNFDAKTGVATVDLTAEAGNVQGSEAAQNMRASFVYTLTALKDVKAVQLWVNGRPAVLHGIVWDRPISKAQMDERSSYKIEPVVKFMPRS